MKKILTTLLLIAGISGAFAQWQQGGPNRQNNDFPRGNNNYNSALTVNTATQRQFSVMVNNYQYQSNGNGQDVNINQLQAGNHQVTIYEWRRNFWGKTVQHVIYNSNINFRPGFETLIYINVLGQVNISERQLYNYNGNNGNGNGNGYGRLKNKHKNKKQKQCGGGNNRNWDDD